jgi:two-component system phosphate regulon response regulator PhoB
MRKGRVLIIDDEADLVELVRYNLVKDGYQVVAAYDGVGGLRMALGAPPDLIILDLMMPGMDGLEVCRRLRRETPTKSVALIMLTAKTSEADRVVGLELGADDYVSKPFSPRELLARVRALLRRTNSDQESPVVIRQAGLTIDLTRHEVIYHGRQFALTPTEFRMLHCLASRPGRVLTRDQIIAGVFEKQTTVFDRTIDVHIAALRKKLEEIGDRIETVRSFGYKWREGEDIEV